MRCCKNITYGYARVSTKEQNLDRQLIALSQFGIQPENIFLDKQSGKNFNRPAYQKLILRLNPYDTLVIKSIDRLGRNYQEILEQWRYLSHDKQVFLVVLDMPLLDTRQKDHSLTDTFIADLVLQVLSYVAQTEHEFNHRRQAEGIAAAKAKGVRFGRPPLKRPDNFSILYNAWCKNEISARKAAKQLGVSHKTFLSWVKKAVPSWD